MLRTKFGEYQVSTQGNPRGFNDHGSQHSAYAPRAGRGEDRRLLDGRLDGTEAPPEIGGLRLSSFIKNIKLFY